MISEFDECEEGVGRENVVARWNVPWGRLFEIGGTFYSRAVKVPSSG